MDAPPGEYYTDERWQNWIDRIEAEEVDPDEEDSARLLLNLQDDAAIAVAKILRDEAESRLDPEDALEELDAVREIVLAEVTLDDEEKRILVDGVQTSLVPVFYAAEEYLLEGPAETGTVPDYVEAAAEAEAEDDLEDALGYCVQAGTLVIDGADFDIESLVDLEYGLVSEWVNGLDSLRTAMSDPEVVEPDEE